MKPDELKKFLQTLKNTDIEELKVELNGEKVFFKKSDVVTLDKEPEVTVKKAAPKPEPLKPVKATMVGTFFIRSQRTILHLSSKARISCRVRRSE